MASGRQARRNVLWQFIDPSYYGARMREVKEAAQQVARRLKSLACHGAGLALHRLIQNAKPPQCGGLGPKLWKKVQG